MAALFASGRVIDLILLFIVVECALLALLRHEALRLRDLLANILSGAALMLAVRSALVGAEWVWVAACLAGALVAHLADLYLRVRRGTG